MHFRDRSIATQILIAFAVIVALAGATGALNLYLLSAFSNRFTVVVEKKAQAMILAGRLRGEMGNLRIVEKNLLLRADDGIDTETRVRLNKAIEHIAESLSALNRLQLSVQTKQLIDRFTEEYRAYGVILEQLAGLIAEGRIDQARALTFSEARARAHAAQDRLAALVTMMEQRVVAAGVESKQEAELARRLTFSALLAMLIFGAFVAFAVSRQLRGHVQALVKHTTSITAGHLETSPPQTGTAELKQLSQSIVEMQRALRRVRDEAADEDWIKTGLARLSEVVSGDPELAALAAAAIGEIASRLESAVAALYVLDRPAEDRGEPRLALLGSWAFSDRKRLSDRFALGEGLVGQCALEQQPIRVRNLPEDYVRIRSGLGESLPRIVQVMPFMHERHLAGVVELGLLAEPSAAQQRYLERAMATLAVAVESARSRATLAATLASSRQLNEELKSQQEELKSSNEELEEQSKLLQQSEARLTQQQEELRVSNEELEEKNFALEAQKRAITDANHSLDEQRVELQQKAEALSKASRYKSEFLANMSHELRTPLNSLLLLAGDLADNREGNLSDEQIEAARIIRSSGNDLRPPGIAENPPSFLDS